MGRFAECRRPASGRRARALPADATARRSVADRGAAGVPRDHALPQHDSARNRRRSRRAIASSSTRSARRSAGTRWRSSCARTRNRRSWAATSRASSRSALLYDIGFGHFWHAPTRQHGGDLIYVQGHVSPGIYARAFVEGRLTEQQLLNFRQESDGKGIPSYPHPWLMPDFWQFPTVSMGLGPLMAIYQARFLKYLEGPRPREDRRPQGVGVPRRRRMRRAGIAGRDLAGGPRAPRQPDLRHQLQPAAARRTGARQRQDHPGAGRRVPRRRLERDQGRLGLGLGQALREGQGRHPAEAHGGVRRRPVPGLQEQERRVRARAFLQHAGAEGAGRRPVRRRGVEAQPRRPRSVQGLRGVRGGGEAQGPADGDPRQDRQGLRHGRIRRRPDDRAPGEEDDGGRAEAVPRPLRHPDARRQDRRRCRSSRWRRTARRCKYLQERRAALGGYLPQRRRKSASLAAPPLANFDRLLQSSRRARDLDDDGVRADAGHAGARQDDRQAHRADRSRRIADVRHGGHVPPARHLLGGGPALQAAGRRPAHVLPRGQVGPGAAGRHQRSGRDELVDRRRRRRTAPTTCR